MTGIVIGAGAESIYAINTARKLGHTIIAVDGNKKAPGLKYADLAIVSDIKEPENVIKDLGQITPEFILPVPVGRILTTAGYLCDYYKLKGLSLESSILCTDKLLFHKKMQEHGLRQIECYHIASGHRIKESDYTNYPFIIKPRFGSGSREVKIIKDPDELKKEFSSKLPLDEDFIIETAMKGDEYGVDAAVINSRFNLILLRKKVITPPPIRQCIAYASIGSSSELLYHKVESYMAKAVKALGMNHCLLHADLIINSDLEVSAIEISGRPSGHRLHDLFTPMASGIDMIQQYINYSCGFPYSFEPKSIKSLAIRYFDFQNCKITKQPDIEDLQKTYDIWDYQCKIGGEFLDPVKDGHSIMDRGYFILSGENPQDALQKCQEVINLFEKE